MSGKLDRRALLGAFGVGGALLARPALAGGVHAAAHGDVGAYLDLLKRRGDDAGGGRFIGQAEDLLLPEHNQFRAKNGLGALHRHPELDAAARAHAADMLQRGYFEHHTPEGFSAVERVGLLARRFVGLAGENIVEVEGGPPSTAAELAQLWRDSPGHRANMLRGAYTHIGFGVARRGDRTVGAAAFGQSFAELNEPVPFRIDDLRQIGASFGGRSPVRGYALEPVGGGEKLGPFWLEDPPAQVGMGGAYSVKAYLSDPEVARRFLVVDGPIIEAA